MAVRYSGRMTVRLQWNDRTSMYHARVTDGQRGMDIVVGAPAVLKIAVDSPSAYDGAAQAAIAFALEEYEIEGIKRLEYNAEYDDRGLVVSCKRN